MSQTQIIISIIGLVITVFGAIVSHLCFTVWWASKITTTLTFLRQTVERMEKHQDGYYTKEEAIRELALANSQREALWKRHDETKARVESLERELAFIKGEKST